VPATTVAPPDDLMRDLVREEIRRALASLPGTLARIEAGQGDARAALARLESELRSLRQQRPLRTEPGVAPLARSVPAESLAAKADATDRSDAGALAVDFLPPPYLPRLPEEEFQAWSAP
jgi:hypothetical protein